MTKALIAATILLLAPSVAFAQHGPATPRSARCRAPWCWGRSARSPAPSLAIPQDPRSRVRGELIDPDRPDLRGKPRKTMYVAQERKSSAPVEPDPPRLASKKMRA